MRIQGFVLTGGASRRMGRDKAAIVMSGQTLAQKAVNTLNEFCDEVFTVGGESGFSDAQHLIDLETPFAVVGRAAMAGIYTALRHCTAEYAAILPCDMPNVSAEVFRILLEKIEAEGDADAAIPLDRAGSSQQVCAVFRPKNCLAVIERLPTGRTPAVKDMIRELKVRIVDFSEFRHLPSADSLFANLNRPEDLSVIN